MKKYIKRTTFLVASSIFLLLLIECKDDTTNVFGYNYIYMPQANVSGGSNQNYFVPSGVNSNTFNYKIDTINHKVNVYLGVSVSGQEANEGCSVDISVNNDTTNQIISGGAISNAVLLPQSIYTLPTMVTVHAGSNETHFNLSIDSDVLKAYTDKNMILTVTLSNPTNYLLNNLYNKTVVIINVTALKLQ